VTLLRVFVNDVLEIDISGSFNDGRLCFYNFSQSHVRYSGFTVAPLFGKEIVIGPDIDVDGEIDLVVEVGQTAPTSYHFTISYSHPEEVLIEDTVPAEWDASLVTNDGGRAVAFKVGRGPNNMSATRISWRPDPAAGTSVIEAELISRERPNGKFAPTSCGGLFLNDGAQAFEIDPLTDEPRIDPVTGERLPPIRTSNNLCVAAVEDVDGDGVIVRDGSGDEDGDGLTDLEEACDLGTDPCLADTDADGSPDGEDCAPLNAANTPGGLEICGDGMDNDCDDLADEDCP
jgi:hypothetical protein